jgi:hypothetical protein
MYEEKKKEKEEEEKVDGEVDKHNYQQDQGRRVASSA